MASDPEEVISSPFPQTLADLDRSPARYLLAISTLSVSDPGRIATGELQEYLNVTPASVTEMVSKLDDRELVEYEKYQGVRLTKQGDALAKEAGWRFCIVSTFFDNVLDMTVDEETAFDIGFVLPRSAVIRLRELFDSPCLDRCPRSEGGSRVCTA